MSGTQDAPSSKLGQFISHIEETIIATYQKKKAQQELEVIFITMSFSSDVRSARELSQPRGLLANPQFVTIFSTTYFLIV